MYIYIYTHIHTYTCMYVMCIYAESIVIWLPNMRNHGETLAFGGGTLKFHPRGACLVFQRCQGYKQTRNPHTHTRTHAHAHTHTHTHTRMMCTYIYMYTYICAYTCVHAICVYVYVYVYMVCVRIVQVYVRCSPRGLLHVDRGSQV